MIEKFRFLKHTADIKFRAFGGSIEQVFKNSALAVSKAICDKDIEKVLVNNIRTQGNDKENLLYNFLDEIIFLIDSENFIVSEIRNLKISGNENSGFELSAELAGDNSEKYEIKEHIKSVTYHEMFVREENGKWIAQVVLDV